MTPCLACGEAEPVARRLCGPCYNRHRRAGTLAEFPPSPRRAGRPRTCLDVYEDAAFLVAEGGYRWDEPRLLAERLGLGIEAYRKAIQRARRILDADRERVAS